MTLPKFLQRKKKETKSLEDAISCLGKFKDNILFGQHLSVEQAKQEALSGGLSTFQ